MKKSLRIILEERINKSKSIVNTVSSVFVFVICLLGIITFFSAVKAVIKEAQICLDEKFNMVTYTIGADLKTDTELSRIDYHLKNFSIGKYGFNAILYVKDGKISGIRMTDKTKNSEEIIKIFNEPKRYKILEESLMPFLFTKSGFKEVAPYFMHDGQLYNYRISKTDIEDVYVMSAAGQDEYIIKMIRIITSAMILTLIAVPLLIYMVKKWLTIIKEQLDELNVKIESLETGHVETKKLSLLIHSKNEIGKIAESISHLTKKLDEKANIDQLTTVKNKRYLNGYLDTIKTNKKIQTVGAIMLDIDYFKQYNDTYGHLQGDTALKAVAKQIEKVAGKKNLVARFGGEEFIVIVKNETINGFEEVCKNIVESIRELNIEHKNSLVSDILTISAGGFMTTIDKYDGVKLIEKADNAVYKAKQTGRNKFYVIKSKAKKS
ncbi:MAG: diguanylate cyclase [Clostridia bacterium]